MSSTSKAKKSSSKNEKEEKKSSTSKKSTSKKRGPGRPPKKKSEVKVKKNTKNKKTETKSIKPQKKAKSVIVDVIKDDDEIDFFRSSAEDIIKHQENSFEPEVLIKRAEDLAIDGEDFAQEKKELHIKAEEVDSQKKYFEELNYEIEKTRIKKDDIADNEIEEILEEEFNGDTKHTKKKVMIKNEGRKLGLYSSFVWKFAAVFAFIFILIFFVSFSSLTIDIVPKTETLNESTLIKVTTDDSIKTASFIDPRDEVRGVIEEMEVNFEKEFSASGEEFVGEEIIGRVKIINDYSRSQSLVKTTRLHAPDGKEYRINEAVNIPAGGEVWVDIYVENPSRDLAISPTKFTIPGLWSGLQDYIYAQSEESFKFEQKKDKYVRASDLAMAKNESENEYNKRLEKKISDRKTYLEKQDGQKKVAVFLNDYIRTSTEAEDNQKIESFIMSVEGSARVAFFNQKDLEKIALGKLNLLVPDGKELLEFNSNNITLIFQSFNEDDSIAQIKANFTGQMILKNNENPINKELISGLNEDQISAFLSDQEEIKDFTLNFKPSFIKKAPKLVDKIEINIVEE